MLEEQSAAAAAESELPLDEQVVKARRNSFGILSNASGIIDALQVEDDLEIPQASSGESRAIGAARTLITPVSSSIVPSSASSQRENSKSRRLAKMRQALLSDEVRLWYSIMASDGLNTLCPDAERFIEQSKPVISKVNRAASSSAAAPQIRAPQVNRAASSSAAAPQGIRAPESPPAEMLKNSSLPREILVATWNIGSASSNPFETWISNDLTGYDDFMTGIEGFLESPGDYDVPIQRIFTDAHFQELELLMQDEGWQGLDIVEDIWRNTNFSKISGLRSRKIVSGFLKDRHLENSQLVSIPDQATGAICISDEPFVACRPAVTTCYLGSLKSIDEWWLAW